MFTTIDQFFNDFRIKNNQFPNETVLNRGMMRLKREIRELKSLVDCLLGKEIEPWHEGKVYEIDEYVSYNGIIYRSNLDSNVAMNPQTSGFWDQQDIETIKSRNQAFKYIEYTSDGVQRHFETPFQMDSTPAVFADGRLLSPTKFTWASGYIELNNPVGNLKNVTIIAGLSYEAVTVQPKQLFVAEDNQYHFETRFQLSNPAVFKDGLYLTSGFVFGSNYIDFDDPLPAGTNICIINGTQSGIDLYSKQDMDIILGRYYTRDETYSKAEVDSEVRNSRDLILTDPALAKSAETYTKLEVDKLVSGIDVTQQMGQALAKKADKASSLVGYGIEDAYDKGAVDVKLQDKLNVIDFNAANILARIRDSEGAGTGLNADTLKGLKPEQFVRRDMADHTRDVFTVDGKNSSLELPATGDIQLVKPIDTEGNEVSYDFLNELNAKGSIIIIEGEFKGSWWDDIRNFGVLEPELYNWVVEVHPLFVGRQYDFVPKTYGDGFLYKAWKEEGASGSFAYGFMDANIVKMYSVARLENGLYQDVPAHYTIKGYRKVTSVKFVRNQGDEALEPRSFTWDADASAAPTTTDVQIPEVATPDILSDNALKVIKTEVLHETDNTTNVVQTKARNHHQLTWSAPAQMGADDYWIRVRGGIPGQVVSVKITNGSLISTPHEFDSVGELLICIRGLDPLKFAPTVVIESSRCAKLLITPEIRG